MYLFLYAFYKVRIEPIKVPESCFFLNLEWLFIYMEAINDQKITKAQHYKQLVFLNVTGQFSFVS